MWHQLLQQLLLESVTSYGGYYFAEKNTPKKALEILACALDSAQLLVEMVEVEVEVVVEMETKTEVEVNEPSL